MPTPYNKIKQSGQTLVEALVAVSVVSILALGISGAATFTTNVSEETAKKNVAIGIANEEMELIRAIPYSDIGFSSPQENDPAGIFSYNKEITRGGQTFNVSRRIEYVNDPLTPLTEDYKKVWILISWLDPNNNTKQVSLTSYVSQGESDIYTDKTCPPGLRLDEITNECVEPPNYTCLEEGFQCVPNQNNCTDLGGNLQPGHLCKSGFCCSGLPLCEENGHECVNQPSDCGSEDESYYHVDNSYYCETGMCCTRDNCADHGSWYQSENGSLYKHYSCIDDSSDCDGKVHSDLYCDTDQKCCQPIQYCVSNPDSKRRKMCVDQVSTCENTYKGKTTNSYPCQDEDDYCCRYDHCSYFEGECVTESSCPTDIGATIKQKGYCEDPNKVCCYTKDISCTRQSIIDKEISQSGYTITKRKYFSCVPTENDCVGTTRNEYYCESGVCCQPPRNCEGHRYSCYDNKQSCESDAGEVKDKYTCPDNDTCCDLGLDMCSHHGSWDKYKTEDGRIINRYRTHSCVATENDCAGTTRNEYYCESGVCCQPPPDCEGKGYSCYNNKLNCTADSGTVVDTYACHNENDVCCDLPDEPADEDKPGMCTGPMICNNNECETSSDCKENRPNTAGPCYFKDLPGEETQCGREIVSWECIQNQWSLHCTDSYNNKGTACTNGCNWTPTDSCIQQKCPADSTCAENWGGRMDLCRQRTYFIEGGCEVETNLSTGEEECVDHSDGTCYGALCEENK